MRSVPGKQASAWDKTLYPFQAVMQPHPRKLNDPVQRELLAPGFLGRHEDLHLGQREGQEAEILQQPAPGR
jgi:hypothetical protein